MYPSAHGAPEIHPAELAAEQARGVQTMDPRNPHLTSHIEVPTQEKFTVNVVDLTVSDISTGK